MHRTQGGSQMRAIVCIAHEREHTVLPYIISVTVFHLYS